MKAYRHILVATNNGITTITLNRPEKKNALNFAMMDELISAAKTIKKDRSIRAVVLTGAGADFCSGLDLSELNSTAKQLSALYQLAKPTPSKFQQVCLIWQSLPVPVIAQIDGVCIGGGLQLALGADIRIATRDARFAILESKWGLVADMGITQTARLLPSDRIFELAATARMIDADTALADGLISHVADDVAVYTQALIDEICHRSPDAVLAAKRITHARTPMNYCALYHEKLWQLRLILGKNRKLAIKKAKDSSVAFVRRQFG